MIASTRFPLERVCWNEYEALGNSFQSSLAFAFRQRRRGIVCLKEDFADPKLQLIKFQYFFVLGQLKLSVHGAALRLLELRS